jgi:hypothetical protein
MEAVRKAKVKSEKGRSGRAGHFRELRIGMISDFPMAV